MIIVYFITNMVNFIVFFSSSLLFNCPLPWKMTLFKLIVDELPEHMRHLVLEPVTGARDHASPTDAKSPVQSPVSDEEGK